MRASAGQRAGAYLIDFAIVAVIATLVWVISRSPILVSVAVIELWAISWIWEGHTGATPGNLICGIRTVRRDSGVSIGARGLFTRSLLMGVSHVIPLLLPLSLAASGALDGVANARLVDVRKARRAASAGLDHVPNLEARVTGASSGSGTVAVPDRVPVPGPITQTPLTQGRPAPAPIPAPIPVAVEAPVPVPAPAAAQVPAAPIPSDAGTVSVFELTDGTVIRATGLGFIGRAPRAPESIPDAILVRVPDGARSLSRTHASFGIEDGQLWVQDLGSANGASIRHLGGGVTTLTPHSPYFPVPSDVLVLGGDAELAIRRVRERAAPPAPTQAAAVAEAPVPVAQTEVAAETPTPEPTPPTPARMTVALQFQNGTTVPIRGVGYIGRAPSLPDGERPDAALIAVPDGDRSVSRTHGRFGIVGDQTWFEDLGSGNGSSLRTGDGRSGPMTPHQRFGLIPGMVLQLGDCLISVVSG